MVLKINSDLKSHIWSLKEEEFKQLEENILKEGIRDSIIVWNGFILDGHNRHKIAIKHNLTYKIKEIKLENIEEAKDWIDRNQIGRRNLTPDQLQISIGRRYLAEKKAQGGTGANQHKEQSGKICHSADLKYNNELESKVAKFTTLKTETILAKEYGVAPKSIRNYAKKAQEFEKLKTEKPKDYEDIKAGKTTIKEVTKEKRLTEKREKQKEFIEKKAEMPDGKYDLIYCDPPWRYDYSKSKTRDIENHYPTMSLEDIKNLKVPSADNCLLLMWATAPKLKEALEVMDSWGFEYKTNAIWDKEVMGLGYWFRIQHELLLVGVKGSVSPPEPSKRYSSIIREKRSSHSKKPSLHKTIEQQFPNMRYLEMFAREKVNDKWSVFGNQV